VQRTLYRFRFRSDIPIAEIDASLLLAYFAVEGLHGEAEAQRFVMTGIGPCVIDVSTPVGRDLAKILMAFVHRQFGDSAFLIQQIQINDIAVPGKVAA